jgi:hypothetical protein
VDGGPDVVLPVVPGPALPVWIPVHLAAGQTTVSVRSQAASGQTAAPAIISQSWQLLAAGNPAPAS